MCDDSFSSTDAQVVCRQLGYNTTNATVYSNATFGEGTGYIWLDNVTCWGNESRLSDCSNLGWGIEDCLHAEDVGVTCGKLDLKLLSLFSFK